MRTSYWRRLWEAGADDMIANEDSFEIVTDPAVHTEVHHALTDAGYEIAESDVEQVPSMESTPTDPGDIKKLAKMIEVLEEYRRRSESLYKLFHRPL